MAAEENKDYDEPSFLSKAQQEQKEMQTLFESEDIHDALSSEQLNGIIRYLYLLLIQIMISLGLEIFSMTMADDFWFIPAFAYFANATKLYVIMCCLPSMKPVIGDRAKLLIFIIGPIISVCIILYDCYWTSKSSNQGCVALNIQYVKHFNRYKVSIAAVTALCGVMDGFITIVDADGAIYYILIIICWGAFCLITGLLNLWKLRHDPTFTFRNMLQAPFKMSVVPDDEAQSESISEDKSVDDQEQSVPA